MSAIEKIHVPKIDAIKSHLRRNKKVYIVGSVCFVVGVAGGAWMFRNEILIIDSFNFLKWKSPHTSTTVIIRRGHPGNIVKCVETGELFGSQNRAAEVTGVSPTTLSRHLNGIRDHANGLHFENLGEATATATPIAA